MDVKVNFIAKFCVSGNLQQIAEINTEEDLFAFSRKLRMYFDLGMIEIPVVIRDAMNEKLDQIYRSQQEI